MARGDNPLLDEDEDDFGFSSTGSSSTSGAFEIRNPFDEDDDEEDFSFPSKRLEVPAIEPPSGEGLPDLGGLPELNDVLGTEGLASGHLDTGLSHRSTYENDNFEVIDEDPFDSIAPSAESTEFEDDDPFGDPFSTFVDTSDEFDSAQVISDTRASVANDSIDSDPFSEGSLAVVGDWDAFDESKTSLEDSMDFEGVSLDLDAVIHDAIINGASDIHINPGDDIAYSVRDEIVRATSFGNVDPNMTVRLQQSIISNVLESIFVQDLELDTSYVVRSGASKGRRLRLSIGKSGGNVSMVFRIIADKMPTPDELEIPQEMRDWVNLPNGLVLVNGPTGSGKSTTLSSLIQEMQFNRPIKIITVEKPVEFVYDVQPNQKAFIVQREVGRDTRSFANGLKSAMRQAPKVILVGEVRDREEIDSLLRAAETGHLAISTMHTTSCPQTVDRILSLYDGDEQRRVLSTLAGNLRGMMVQTLVHTPDHKGRVAVREILQVTREVKEYIRNGDVGAIQDYMESNKLTMAHQLLRAARTGKITMKAARDASPEPLYFDEIKNES